MRKIKLFFAAAVMLLSALAYGQNITVSGVVTDANNGEPVPFAAIQLKGTMTGASTDVDGKYFVSVPSNGTLVFSSIGYVSQEIQVSGRNVINVSLAPDSETLDETIVVAFGTTTREAFTGSASVVKSEDLAKHQTTNVANALVGSVAGLQMRGGSGAPGAGAGSIKIRGIASMYAGTDPLIIVDGAPYSASLSNIPQGDIESVTVLKDAASAALYGARGAAGVILITTKKSRTRDAIVNFDAKWGVNTRSVQDYETVTDPAEYYEASYAMLFNNNYYNQGMSLVDANAKANKDMIQYLGYQVYTVPDGQQLVGVNGKLNPSATLGYAIFDKDTKETYWLQPDDWKGMAYKSAIRKDYNLSINGGSDRSSFYASLGYLNEDGVIEYSGYKRLSARLRADYQVKKWLNIGGNVGYVHSNTESNPNMDTSLGSTNLMYYTTQIAPIYPVFVRVLDGNNPVIRTDANGNEQYDYGVAGKDYPVNRAFLQTGNPLGSNRYNKHFTIGNQLNATFTADATITEFLKLNISSNVNWGSTLYHHYDNALYGPKVSVNGELTKYQSTGFRTNNTQTLTYFDTFGNHNVNVLVGHEYYDTKTDYLEANARGGFSPDIQQINAFANHYDSSGYSTEYNIEGYFASAQYNYAEKYYLSASFRRDASSRFAKDNRWGNFWSFGGAWIASKEGFLAGSSWVDMLKLKFSVGQQGNDSLSNSWYWTDLYSLANSGTYSMSPTFSNLGNPDITWETTTNINLGTEFSLWRGRLSGTLDVYKKITTDQLFWLSVPEHAGVRGYYGNMGDISNTGVELVLNAALVRSRNVDWDLSFNISHNSTKILSLPEAKMVDPENGYKGFTESSQWLKVGGPLYNAFRHVYAGVNEKGEALYYVDDDLKGKTDRPGDSYDSTTTNPNKASYYELGSMLPTFFGGFGTNLRVGSFDFTATFDYQIGGKMYDSRYAGFMSPWSDSGDAGHTFHKDWVKSWSVNNTSSSLPRWYYGDQYSTGACDRFLTNASYLNFQSFTVGYTLPKFINVISKARIYVAGENLWFWSARKGLDPRYSFTGNTTVAVYSPVRTISGGIQLTF